ncbi:TlpA family protein disulfide reductase [Muriicola sp.]|uniref:TlpA family protein disulfide reductase n=1 Tax=Muriicola sp. TaxID=2020856 RepID=UPI003C70FF8B
MAIKKKTVLNILLIAFILSFFVTPMGYHGKILLNRIFSGTPSEIPIGKRKHITDYDWRLKDADWNIINFSPSRGKVTFVNFWASWSLPSDAQLKSIQSLYDQFKGKVDFYIITNEEQAPVRAYMEKNEYNFPVTYLIIGDKSALPVLQPPGTYIVDKKGFVVAEEHGIKDWDNTTVFNLLQKLLNEK